MVSDRDDEVRLADYLRPHVGGLAGPLRLDLMAGGRSNPTYLVSDGAREWVLRRPPHGHVLPTAHDMAREFHVLRALGPTVVPVPEAVLLCTDHTVLGTDFYVMERLRGHSLRTREQAEELNPQQRRDLSAALVRVLADLHTVDAEQVGLAGFGRPDGYLARQLRRWRQQWQSSRTGDRPEVERLLDELEHSCPESRYPGIVHGDYKTDNVMLAPEDPTRIVGVLDWEMSTLGDTMADLGILLSFWDQPDEPYNPVSVGVTALDGFLTREEVVDLYAALRGVDVTDIDWYIAFADLKVAIILEGIRRRHLQGQTTGEGFDDVGDMVDPLIDRARMRLSSLPAQRRR
ncbi:MAG: phosphotransferase family protein [Nocardioides sp.]|uniref:phosphotransferase family protein n=1 Tax=Nocardioides sp. TaxID=35761 RepID=UPI0039E2EE76